MTPLPKDLLDKIDDEKLGKLLLGNKKGALGKTAGAGEKLSAALVWLSSLGIAFAAGVTPSSARIVSLSTLGLVLVITGLSSFLSSYTGPVWPFAGRPGQRISQSTPLVMIRLFGWLLLVASLAILIATAVQG